MARVTESQVRSVAGEPSSVDASSAISVANLIVDEELYDTTLSNDRLTMIELYLSAHFLVLTTREGPMAAQALGDATERYHNIYQAGLMSTRFGQQAVLLDSTGTLAAIAAKAADPSRKDAQFTVI
jgi:hypothetical protein